MKPLRIHSVSEEGNSQGKETHTPRQAESGRRGRTGRRLRTDGRPVREEEHWESLASQKLRRHFTGKEEVPVLNGPNKSTEKWPLTLARKKLLLTLTRTI